ncbi:uncharacterized protein ATNIH1004_010898 [Aspergillus tanneri]|uniref:Plasma membrane sulfite pump involved in sulfite metabolism n=1 Tax=Aspergillus tanneri TaxID=1220188 RepID=A0A5M9MBQ8_9EURO|nr:uncharacterized protein ATNIH1004_010898 [Aspergillus tanneri]KAA8641959.1 hypothetical protein ATNIH1004_010898 [Aspergillus tanneri]
MSCFLTLGPVGFGGFGIMYLGKVSLNAFGGNNSFHPLAGDIAYILGIMVALALWGFSLLWLTFAFSTVIRCWPIPFNMSWWATTFPFGVFCVNTIQIGVELSSMFFKVIGTLFSVVTIFFWVVTTVGTIREIRRGHIFHIPYLDDFFADEDNEVVDLDTLSCSNST